MLMYLRGFAFPFLYFFMYHNPYTPINRIVYRNRYMSYESRFILVGEAK